MLALTIDEIVEMLGGWVDLPIDSSQAIESIEEYVEHMKAGGFNIGHDYEPADWEL